MGTASDDGDLNATYNKLKRKPSALDLKPSKSSKRSRTPVELSSSDDDSSERRKKTSKAMGKSKQDNTVTNTHSWKKSSVEENRARNSFKPWGKNARGVRNEQMTDRMVEVLRLLMGSTGSPVSIETAGKQSPSALAPPVAAPGHGVRGGRYSQSKDEALGAGGEITSEGTHPRLAKHDFQQLTSYLGWRDMGAASGTPGDGSNLVAKGVGNATDTNQLQNRSTEPMVFGESPLKVDWSANVNRVPFVRWPHFRLLRFEIKPERLQELKGRPPMIVYNPAASRRPLTHFSL